MHLRRLAVADFRSWERAELDLEPGVSVLVGPNGVGKTNLVEAVGYLATLGSHRVAGDAPLVRRGAERAVVRATVVHQGRELTVELEIAPGRANRARVNRAPVARPRDVLGILRTVLFAPEDLALVRGDPGRAAPVPRRPAGRPPSPLRGGARRLRPGAPAAVRAAQDRPQRRPVAPRGRTSVPSTCGTATSPGTVRRCWPGAWSWSPVSPRRPSRRSRRSRRRPSRSRSSTAPSLDGVLPARRRDELEPLLLDALARGCAARRSSAGCVWSARTATIWSCGSATGPAKGYASHGESWALALALRLASYRLLCADGVEPVLILDDVFAELDDRRRRALAGVAARAEQVLVTAAVADDVPAGLAGVRFAVNGGRIEHLVGRSAADHHVSASSMITHGCGQGCGYCG